jgi:ATP synthase assembly factor FMC1
MGLAWHRCGRKVVECSACRHTESVVGLTTLEGRSELVEYKVANVHASSLVQAPSITFLPQVRRSTSVLPSIDLHYNRLTKSRNPPNTQSPSNKMAHLAPQIRSLYRRLLRELPFPTNTIPTRTTHQKLSAPSTIQQRLRDTVVQPSARNTTSQIQQAEQFAQYAHAQRTYIELIERYNPGMGMSEEERVRLSARRIGMNLPVEYEAGKE